MKNSTMFAVCLVFALTGCGLQEDKDNDTDNIVVVTLCLSLFYSSCCDRNYA